MAKELLFYEKPEMLHRERHGKLRFTALPGLQFASTVNSVPLTGPEFFETSRDLPILFARDGEGRYFPIALLSLRDGANDLVDDQGHWKGAYIPGFIRRYPFALMTNGALCLDAACTAFSTGTGEPLFKEDGSNAELLERVIGFLREYDALTRSTATFCEALAAADLFAPFALKPAGDAPGKGVPRLDGLYLLDEEKVAKLPDTLVTTWFRNGWLPWIYAHLHSLSAIHRLLHLQQAASAS